MNYNLYEKVGTSLLSPCVPVFETMYALWVAFEGKGTRAEYLCSSWLEKCKTEEEKEETRMICSNALLQITVLFRYV